MDNEKAVAIVVPHTHWDREWRYPIWQTRAMLVGFMDRLLDILENDPEYRCFVLDGQSIAVEDYLQIRPESTERVNQAVSSGRLKIGPWYTLPDLYPLDGECLVRNLMAGIRFCGQFGGHLGVGYNSFGWGQTAQFPQIYAGFGFDFLIAAKRASKTRAPHCEFFWEAPDGTRILTTRLGTDARAGGFFNAYIPVRFGMSYTSEQYRFGWGRTGRVMHRADEPYAHEDYFRLDRENGYHPEKIREAFQAAWNGMDETLAPEYRLILDGSDFTAPQPTLTRMIRDANEAFDDKRFELGTLEQYGETLGRLLADKDVPTVRGELRDGPASASSANALAVRIPIKQLNKKAENVLLRSAEPWASLLAILGEEYPKSFLSLAWKYLLRAHPHDSINGVTQDKTADDTVYRINQALELGQVVQEQNIARLIPRIDLSSFEPTDQLLLVVNPLPFPVHEVIEVCLDTPVEENVWAIGLADHESRELDVQPVAKQEKVCPVHDPETRPWPFHLDRHTVYVDPGEIPAGGYKVLAVTPTVRFPRDTQWWPPMRTSVGRDIARTTDALENEHLKVEFQPDGTFHLVDKMRGSVVENAHYFEDTGDVGDYWAFYPPHHNRTLTSRGRPAQIQLEDNGPLSATIGVKINLTVPAHADVSQGTAAGESRRSDSDTELSIYSRFTLQRGASRLDIQTAVKNTARDHRLRLMIPTDLSAGHADAAGHFNVDQRPIHPTRERGNAFYPEMQTAPMQIFVDVADGTHGLAVVSDSLTEYQLLDDDRHTLALTLFRAVRNRICTEMRSTGDFPRQHGGQLLETLEYRYAIYPHEGDWHEGGVYRQARRFNARPVSYQINSHDGGTLPPTHSLWSVEPAELIMSTFKQAEDRGTFILRLHNPTDLAVEGRVVLPVPIRAAWLTDLNEQRQTQLSAVDGNRARVDVGPHKIVTMEIVV